MKLTLSCAAALDAPLKDLSVITGVYFLISHFSWNILQIFDDLEEKNPHARFSLMFWVFHL